jgi:hypothetical protein
MELSAFIMCSVMLAILGTVMHYLNKEDES